jgi:uncharacterized membrane protein SpoIIM required for sporulation
MYWDKMEIYDKRLSGKSLSTLSKDEILEYAALYRRVGLNLAYAKTQFSNSEITRYLNQLAGLARGKFYTSEKPRLKNVAIYFTKTFPEKTRSFYGYFFVAAALFLIGALFLAVLGIIDQNYLYFFIPDYDTGFDFSLTAVDRPFLSSFVITNNIRVAATAYAFGVSAGIGTVYVLLANGAIIGALTCLTALMGGDMIQYISLILPHGFIELTAIFISGAGGLVIGKSILIPKNLSRGRALIKAANETAALIPGVAAMLVVAGVIEGFITPANIPASAKLAFSAITLVATALYFILAGRSK